MPGFFDRMFIRKIRDADTEEEAMRMTKDFIDPNTGEAVAGDNGADTHIHLHMNGKGEEDGGGMDAGPDMNGGGGMPNGGGGPDLNGPAGGGDLAQIAARVAALEEQVQALMDSGSSDEEDVELEDPDTQDARRFKLRRRDAMRMKMGDEGAEIPIPERNPDIVGETDLPGIEDLDKRMGTNDRAKARRAYARTRDSMDQEELWGDLVANAEIIAPGTKIPTFDARMTMQSTAERLCKYRRLVLEKGFKDQDTAAVIKDTVGISTFDGLKPLGCDSIKMAFNATANAMRDNNNVRMVRQSAPTRDQGQARLGPPSISQMNKDAKEFWSKQKTNGAIR